MTFNKNDSYSIKPKYQIFVKRKLVWFFAKSISKNIGKKVSKILSAKCSENVPDHLKQSATYAFKTTSKRAIQKPAEATGDVIGSTIADKITAVSKASSHNSPETVTNKRENILNIKGKNNRLIEKI